jgi:bifunctional ADP-heptose synthase (sugar kinase/adenylyltransferase)
MLSTELIDRILAQLPRKTIGLVGDLFLDRYLDIDAARNEPSVETGLTAYQVTGVRSYPGALGTVLNNLAALGVGRIVPISIIGDDGEGYELMQELAKLPAVDATHIIRSAERRTPTYTKPMLREGMSVRELNRLDIKNRTPTPPELQAQIVRQLELRWSEFDALLVLDQVSEVDCGAISGVVRNWICDRASTSLGTFVLADSREQIGKFRSLCVKPNAVEAEKWVPGGDPRKLAELVNGPVLLTRSEAGMVLAQPGNAKATTIPAYPVPGPIDPCGAGDSCSAAIACAMATGAALEEAAAFGNLIASITVQQIGVTGTATPEQVRERWKEVA